MARLIDHPLRHATASELHARPFPHISAPARAAFFAYTSAQNDSGRREAADREHFLRLLDHYGVAHPADTESHFFGQLGEVWIKWECHTEFVTYTALSMM